MRRSRFLEKEKKKSLKSAMSALNPKHSHCKESIKDQSNRENSMNGKNRMQSCKITQSEVFSPKSPKERKSTSTSRKMSSITFSTYIRTMNKKKKIDAPTKNQTIFPK